RQPWAIVHRQLPGPQPLRLDLRLAAHQPLRHLRLRHLEREQGDGHLVPDAEVRGDPEPERRLPHAWPRGDDDQVPGLESAREPVDVAKAGRDAGDLLAGFVESRDPLEALLEERLDVGELGRDAALRELEDDLLRLVDEILCVAGPLPAEAGDLAPRT